MYLKLNVDKKVDELFITDISIIFHKNSPVDPMRHLFLVEIYMLVTLSVLLHKVDNFKCCPTLKPPVWL